MNKQKPTVFIGSSSEGLDIAREVELQLKDCALPTIWKDDVFQPGSGTLEALMKALGEFHFAVMVLSPDDTLESREKRYLTPRDNVIFELGLFMGHLGPKRTFIVHESAMGLKLPSDLCGITVCAYEKRDNLSAALSPACTPVIKAIRSLGPPIEGPSPQLQMEPPFITESREGFMKYLGVTEEIASLVVAHCQDSANLIREGVSAPAGTFIHYIEKEGFRLPDLLTIHEPSQADWSRCAEARTVFVVDAPQVNAYAKYLLDFHVLYLIGSLVHYEIIEIPGGPTIQRIKVGRQGYGTNKYNKPGPKEPFGFFTDHLLIMRMPGEVVDGEYGRDSAGENEKIVWLVYGITTKGTHAGAHFFRKDNFAKFEKYLWHEKSVRLPKYFEAVFMIPEGERRVEDFDSFRLVHFAGLRSKRECYAGDPPPAEIERCFLRSDDGKDLDAMPVYSVHLDLVAACNFNCPGCIEPHVRSRGLCLATRKTSRILVDLHKQGCRDIRFYGGEPTLHPDFPLIMELASAMGYQIMVVTNGSLLKEPQISQSLIEAQNLHLRVSLDADSQAVHETRHGLRPNQLDFESMRQSIVALIESGVSVSISYLLTRQSFPELSEACRFWRQVGASSFNPRIPMAVHGEWEANGRYSRKERMHLQEVLEKYAGWIIVPDWVREWVEYGYEPETEKDYDRCYSGYYRFGISPYSRSQDDLRETKSPFVNKLHFTENAWISLCLYYRYDERFGCIYPECFAQWHKEARTQKLASIQPRQGMCSGTVCSRAQANKRILSNCRKY